MKLKNINMPKPTPEQLALMPQNAIGDIGTRYDIAVNTGDDITLYYCVTYFPYIELIYSDLTGENKALCFIWDEDLATANSIFGTSFTTAGWFLVATDFSTIEAYTGTLDINASVFTQVYSRTYFDLLFIYNIACASTSGVNLLTAQKYCEGNIKVLPVLQEKTATENGEYTVDNGYAGLSKVTVNVASGAELNIAYGDTAPQDTSKLWVNGAEPSKVIATNQLNGSMTTTAQVTNELTLNAFGCAVVVGDILYITYYGITTRNTTKFRRYDLKNKVFLSDTAGFSFTPNYSYYITPAGIFVKGNKIYLPLVTISSSSSSYYTQKSYLFAYDIATDTWDESLAAVSSTPLIYSAGILIGNFYYAFGGSNAYTPVGAGQAYNTVYRYDIENNVWTYLGTMPQSLYQATAATFDDRYIYLFGGRTGNGMASTINTIYKYDTVTDAWTTLASTLPQPLSRSSAVTFGDKIYLLGGAETTAGTITNKIYAFDKNTETVSLTDYTLAVEISAYGCAQMGNKVYLVSGYTTGVVNWNGIQTLTLEQPLSENQLLINTSLTKNLFKLLNAPTAEVEIGVNGVYRGNANNIAVKETAYVFDTNNYAWVTVDGGVIVDKLASAVTITSEASEYAYNVYDGTDTSGVLRATLGGTNGTLSAKIPCYSGYLFIKGVTPDTIATTLTSGGTLNIAETANAGEYLVTCKGNSNEFVDGSLNITYGKPAVGYNLSYTNTGNITGYTTLNVTYADGSTASINASEYNATIENVTYVQVVKIDGSEYNAFNISASGYTESQLLSGIELTGDLAITIYCNICFVEGTQITLADGSTKAIEDITYDDELLTWNFDEGKFESRKPCWIARAGNASYYWNTELSDGTNLQLVGSKGHRLLNIEQGKFIYAVDSLNEHTFKQDGSTPTVISCDKVIKNVKYYNLATEYNINVFANGVLTSQRLNNMYPIKDMKFEKYAKPVVKREDYAEIPDKYYYGLRVAEQSESQNTENAVIFHNSIKEHIIHNMVERDIGE